MSPGDGTDHYRDTMPPEEAGGGIDPGQLLGALRRRWRIIFLCAAFAFAIAWELIPDDTLVHRAGTSVALDNSRQQMASGVTGEAGPNVRAPDFLASQVETVRSLAVIGAVVDGQGLRLTAGDGLPAEMLVAVRVESDRTPGVVALRFDANGVTASLDGQEVRGAYGDTLVLNGVSFAVAEAPSVREAEIQIRRRDAVLAEVYQGLDVSPRGQSALIDLFYTDDDAARAVRIVNAVAQAYQLQNRMDVRETARVRREFLQQQLVQAEQKLVEAQQVLAAFKDGSAYYSSQQRGQVEQAELLSLDTQREQLQADHRAYQTFVRRIERADDAQIDAELRILMAGTGASSSALLSQLYTQLTQYQNERERNLAAGNASTHPQVLQLNTLISSTRASVVEAARTQVTALAARLASLEEARQRTLATLRTLPAPEAEETRLTQEVTFAQATAQTLRSEHQRALLIESLDLGQVQLLDPARAAVPEMSGGRSKKLVFAVIFGFLFGSAGALAREFSDRSVRRGGEVEAKLAVPGLGIIPPITTSGNEGSSRSLFRRGWAGAGKESPQAAAGQDGYAVAAEAYRRLRTNLVFLRPIDQLRTLVVTSSTSGEGKTTTAANLGVAFARQGRRVLLVDCDLRRPRLHDVFKIEAGPGFVDVLVERCTLEEAVVATAEGELYLLQRGEFDERAIELLSGSRMEQLVNVMRTHFDLVIFDTSPVLLTADAASVAALADGVLLVIRAGHTARDAVGQTSHQLEVVGAQLLGFVLNDPDSIAAKHGEYYPDQYYAVQS